MRAILHLMRHRGAVTGTDLIEATGLARATVIAVCDDLIKAGWVRELPAQKTIPHRGRPARIFEFNAAAGYVVGLDFGVAKATALLTDLRGKILAKASVPLPEFSEPDSARINAIDEAIQSVLASAEVNPRRVLVAVLGIAAPVDRKGKISHGQTFWERLDIGIDVELQARYGWPILLENDANLAALAERWMGVGTGIDDLAVMLAGERIGFGLVASGCLLHGATGRGGEMGMLQLVEGVGTPEGIAALARKMAGTATTRGTCDSAESVTAERAFSAAAHGDETAIEILGAIARRMARVIAVTATLMDPELVVIAGAVAQSSAALLKELEQELATLMPNPPRVAPSTLGDTIVTLGAVRLGLDYVQKNALEMVLDQ